MSRSEEMRELTRRALAHFRAGTTDQAEAPMRMPVAAYNDRERYRREIGEIFMRRPIMLALSVELPGPGSYRAMRVLDVPVLLVRGEDGRARAFLNACRHRGAAVCREGAGSAARFTCPYHAWTYGLDGALLKRYAAETFGDVDHATLGLTELACGERVGMVFAVLTPGVGCDIDAWLGGFATELAHLGLGRWSIFEQREIPGPGWKVALDGYLEAYHHNSLHGRTVGQHTIGNLLVLDTWGPHQRLTFGRKSLAELVDRPEAEWEVDRHIRLIHNCFPNTSISGVIGDHCLVSQVFPGPGPDTTVTRQTVLVASPPDDEEKRAQSENFSRMVLQAVRDEDYAVGATVQAGLGSGANREFVFGRNEPAVQNYHLTVARLMGE